MTFGLMAAMFLFVLAAVSAAGYVFVLRPSRTQAADVQLPSGLSLNGPDLPGAQAAVTDALRLIGEALPQQKNNGELRRELMAAGYRYESAVSVFMGIKTASALLLGVADIAGKYYVPALGAFMIYLVMIVVLVLRPHGLFARAR